MFSREKSSDNYERESFMSQAPERLPPSYQPRISHGQSTPFLPGYLLGDRPSHYNRGFSSWLWSSEMNSTQGQRGLSSSESVFRTPSGQNLIRRQWAGGKSGGPPVKGLYSSSAANNLSDTSHPGHIRTNSLPLLRRMASTTSAPPTTGLFHTPEESHGNPSLHTTTQNAQTLPVSQVQDDAGCSQGDLSSENVLDVKWVTVYGFPPIATSFMLQQFSQYGTIVKHIVVPECNWMHIRYSSKIQAQKALNNDGKVYAGCLKIGVIPCTEKGVVEGRKCQSLDRINIYSPGPSSGSSTNIRPLTAAYIATRMDYEVLKGKPTPKRDASIFSKLKEYMFGY